MNFRKLLLLTCAFVVAMLAMSCEEQNVSPTEDDDIVKPHVELPKMIDSGQDID